MGKRTARGRKKTRKTATEDGESGESGSRDVHVETSKGAGWMDDTGLNPEFVRDVQEKDAVFSLFLQYRKNGDRHEWNDISAQGAEFKSYWAQWESLVIDGEVWGAALAKSLMG